MPSSGTVQIFVADPNPLFSPLFRKYSSCVLAALGGPRFAVVKLQLFWVFINSIPIELQKIIDQVFQIFTNYKNFTVAKMHWLSNIKYHCLHVFFIDEYCGHFFWVSPKEKLGTQCYLTPKSNQKFLWPIFAVLIILSIKQ